MASESGTPLNSASGDKTVHVLLVSPLPPPTGGIATWTRILMERGLPAPYKVKLVDARLIGRIVGERPKFTLTSLSTLTELRRTIRILWQVYQGLRKDGAQIVHVNCSLAPSGVFRDWLCTRIALRFKVPYLVHLRGTLIEPRSKGIRNRLRRFAYSSMFKSAQTIIALNEASRAAVLSHGGDDKLITIIPNYVDYSVIPEGSDAARPEGPVRVAYAGTLMPKKGLDTIISAVKRTPGIEVHLIGHSPANLGDELLDTLRRLGLEKRVILHGSLDHSSTLREIAASEIFFFPSASEGFPLSVAEAMALGLAVVASPVGAIPEMIDVPQGGRLIPAEDVDSYVEALSELRDDPELRRRMGEYNRAKARREYDYEVVVPRLCERYALAIGNDGG